MAITVSLSTSVGSAGKEGVWNRTDRVTEAYIVLTSDRGKSSGVADVISLDEIYTAVKALNPSNPKIDKILVNTFVLHCCLLVRNNVTLDLRNTNVDIDAHEGAARGAMIVCKAFGDASADVLTGDNRAILLTGNTVIIVQNRDNHRWNYGPFVKNATWRNRGGDTQIWVDASAGNRYDWSANWGDRAASGDNDIVEGHLTIFDFEEGYRCNLIGLTPANAAGVGVCHTFIHPDSTIFGYGLKEAEPGGPITAAQTGTFQFESAGGLFEEPIMGAILTGATDSRVVGRAVNTSERTAELHNCRFSGRALRVNRRNTFWDIVGAVGDQIEDVVHVDHQSGNAITGVTLNEDTASGGLVRVAYEWRPRFMAPNGEPVVAESRIDVLLGTRGGSSITHYDTGQNLNVRPDDDEGQIGRIEWDDLARSIPDGTGSRVRDHVRLPAVMSNRRGDANGNNVASFHSATWHMYQAGYLPPRTPTTLVFPFEGQPYGNWEGDISIAYDAEFLAGQPLTSAGVVAARALANTAYLNPSTNPATSAALYRACMLMFEDETTTYSTVALAWAGHQSLLPRLIGGLFRLNGTGARLHFNQGGSATGNRMCKVAGPRLNVYGAAVAGQAYGAATVELHTQSPPAGTTFDCNILRGALADVNGIILRQATRYQFTSDVDRVVTVNDVQGGVLTLENEGTGTVKVLTDSPTRVAAGTNVELVVRVAVTGLIAGDSAQPSRCWIYALDDTAVDPNAMGNVVQETENTTSADFDGLDAGESYRVVWTRPGYEPIVADVLDVEVGVIDLAFAPVATLNAQPVSELPAGVTHAQTYDATAHKVEVTVDAAHDVGGNISYYLNGVETNAYFERLKSSGMFNRAVGQKKATNLIRHPSGQETSLLQNGWLIKGAEQGIGRHILQAIRVHDADNAQVASAMPEIERFAVTRNGTTIQFPEVILYPSVVPMTLAEGTALMDGLEDRLGDRIDTVSDEVTVDGLTADGEAALLGTIWKSGAV